MTHSEAIDPVFCFLIFFLCHILIFPLLPSPWKDTLDKTNLISRKDVYANMNLLDILIFCLVDFPGRFFLIPRQYPVCEDFYVNVL